MFLAGASAGSVTAMSAVFYTQSMLNQVYPGISNINVLGNVDKNFYYGEGNINYTIKGVLDMWGGLAIPPDYLNNPEDFFQEQNAITPIPPMIVFHGKRDITFNYKRQTVLFAPSAPYNSESNCLQTNPYTYSITTNNVADGYLLGGQNIYSMLKSMGIGAELYIDCEMGHGLDEDNDPNNPYQSDFGVATNTNSSSTGVYIAGRAATFFQAIMNNKVGLLTTTKFVECENYRYRCFTADNNEGCSNNDDPANCPFNRP